MDERFARFEGGWLELWRAVAVSPTPGVAKTEPAGDVVKRFVAMRPEFREYEADLTTRLRAERGEHVQVAAGCPLA